MTAKCKQYKSEEPSVSFFSLLPLFTTFPYTHFYIMSRLFVGNLPFFTVKEDLESMFSEYGTLTDAVIIHDDLCCSRGFGFVSFESEEEAKSALDALNGTEYETRKIVVKVAILRTERPLKTTTTT